MLRLPAFEVVAPDSFAGVVAALARPGARVIAGGTDLLPNLKHRLDSPPVLVSLSRLRVTEAALRAVRLDADDGLLRIGAGVTLTELSEHPDARAAAPSLARAAGLVASPSIRNMATIGGNVHLDTRCRYVNQTAFWRESIGGGCLKSEGDVCHVVPGGKNCVAAMSSDCVPVLATLDAHVVLLGPSGTRTVLVADYYNTDGVHHINKAPDELMTELRVPLARGPRRAAYAKWTVRKSIDFPLVSVALRFDLAGEGVDAPITAARVCVGVLAAVPRLLKRTETLHGRRLDDPTTADALCALVAAQCKPLDNVPYESAYRRKMLPVYARRALASLVAAG
jgi:4-hydroxybenzoyl-CoA reductase beta subunit